MKRGGGSSKGSSFEREICKLLSLWWTSGERDDIFWRTAGSGGRATNRMKRGMSTSGAYGDLTFVDPIGADLLKLFCFELKRGYGQWCVLDLIDKKPGSRASTAELFWQQATKSCEDARACYPVVIFRRDQKVSVVMSSRALLSNAARYVGPYRGPKVLTAVREDQVFLMPLTNLLDYITPEVVRLML